MADRRQRRRQKAIFWLIVVAVIGYGVFVGDYRPYHLAILYLEEQRTQERITELESERGVLKEAHRNLQADSLTLETLARDKGMIRPGDLVYRIVRVPPDVREAVAESLAAEPVGVGDSVDMPSTPE